MPSSNFYEALSLKTRVIHRNELNKIKESEIHDEEINSFSENFIFKNRYSYRGNLSIRGKYISGNFILPK